MFYRHEDHEVHVYKSINKKPQMTRMTQIIYSLTFLLINLGNYIELDLERPTGAVSI